MTNAAEAPALDVLAILPAAPAVRPAHRVFYTMDGLRGVAALYVVSAHAADWFKHVRPNSAYLAVDLFFTLSGFVIALSYEQRLTLGLSTAGFMKMRVLRLYPLYLFGTLITLCYTLLADYLTTGGIHASTLLPFAGALLMLPALAGTGTSVVYPLNLPAWSLLSELLVNLLYSRVVRRLTGRMLCAGMLVSGSGLIVVGLTYGSLAIGFQIDTFLPSLLRTLYSFLAGLALYRVWRSGRLSFTASPWIVLGAMMIALTMPVPSVLRPYYDLACALVVFPLIVTLATIAEPRGRWRGIFLFLGSVSYPVYMIHVPLYDAVNRLLPLTGLHRFVPSPLSGCLFLVLLVGLGWFINDRYDRPTRRLLSRGLGSR